MGNLGISAKSGRRSASAVHVVGSVCRRSGLFQTSAPAACNPRLAPWCRYFPQTMGTDIPEGFASDCTQLRLATSRTIGNEGFDTVAFSRIELPAWASYALTFDSEDKTAALSLAAVRMLEERHEHISVGGLHWCEVRAFHTCWMDAKGTGIPRSKNTTITRLPR